MLKRYWRGLPWDGGGWAAGQDPEWVDLRRWAAAAWRRTKPPLLRPGLWMADRLLWPIAAASRSLAFADALAGVRSLPLWLDCVMTGATPLEAHVWRSLQGTPHPLPARSASLVMTQLGDPAGHRLLADKLASARHLAGYGVVCPVLRGLYRRGEPVALPARAAADSGWFVKPRHGHGGRSGFALTRTGDDWWIDQRPTTGAALLARLTDLVQRDDLLLQQRLTAAPDLTDLVADGRPPVLRLVTARRPDEGPFLHSALLSMGCPGRDRHHFLEGALHAPVDPASGRLAAGHSLAEPRMRVTTLAWNGAPLAGRLLAGFDDAAATALRAMAALPPLPLVHWDVVVTPTGPVMLEGNSSGSWILASLPGLDGLDAGPLAPLLSCWARTTTRPP